MGVVPHDYYQFVMDYAPYVYVNKILIISDGIALVEVVEKSVQGVVKTRIFLIIGDLAIQLTGD